MSLRTELRDFINGFFDSPGFGNGFFFGAPSQSGVEVNETTSMTVGAVAACQRIISSAVASLGCYVYEELPDGGHRLAPEHPLFRLVSLAPSPDYPAVDFYAAGQVNLLQNGNGYAEIIRNNGGQPVEFLLRSPFHTHLFRDQTGAIAYRTSDTVTGAQLIIKAEDMIHPKNMGVNPYIGLSPIRMYMREVLGVALASQEYGARLFKNDARPGGYLYSEAVVKPEDKLRQIQSWVAGHTGKNQHLPAMLDGGVKWEQVGINPDEAQFLQTRQFQRSEIASIYGVPAHMLGDPVETKATIEQKALEFLIWTVKPWLRRWEHAMNVKLFPISKDKKPGPKQPRYFIKFDTSEYERSDYATTLKGIQTGRYAGLYTVDEGRKLLGLNPVTDDNFDETKPGKSLWRPVNMAIAGEDPGIYSSGGAGAGSGDGESPDAPTEDQPAPTDDGGDDSRALDDNSPQIEVSKLLFQVQLDYLETLEKPNSKTWLNAFVRVFAPLVGGLTPVSHPVYLDTVRNMKSDGVEKTRTKIDAILANFILTVRTANTHKGEISMKVERRFNKGAEVRAVGGEITGAKIEGYAAVFNEFYMLYEDSGFQVRETIMPGAFSPVMSNDVRCLFNHDADNVLGRSTNGTLVMVQDDKGLSYANAMDETRIGKDVYAFVKRGDVTGCSFAFIVRKATWDEEELDNGVTRWTRKIEEMEQLFDVGPVTYPAYEQTTVDARELRSVDTIPAEIMQRIKAGKSKPAMGDDIRAALNKQALLNQEF